MGEIDRKKKTSKIMIGVPDRPNPTVDVPAWDVVDDPMAVISPTFLHSNASVNYNVSGSNAGEYSPFLLGEDVLTALQRYLPSNEYGGIVSEASPPPSSSDNLVDLPLDAFSCDNFRMYEFKVRRCSRGKSHDWTECPYAHPGEKARRRDPRKYNYSGTACPEFRKGGCVKGDTCEFAHGVFECWLHPLRYRTQACKDGTHCNRRVCFFAHTPDQLRVLPNQSPRASLDLYDGSPLRHAFDSYLSKGVSSIVSSPTSTLTSPMSDSPPMSPNSYSLCGSGSVARNSVGELVASIRSLQIGNGSSSKLSSPTWGVSGYGSPRCSILRPGSYSLPTTPTWAPTRSGYGQPDHWDATCCEEEPAMERVESGRDLRAKIYAKLGKEYSVDRVDSAAPGPDVGWVSELLNMG